LDLALLELLFALVVFVSRAQGVGDEALDGEDGEVEVLARAAIREGAFSRRRPLRAVSSKKYC
jgi:hypothetical protein